MAPPAWDCNMMHRIHAYCAQSHGGIASKPKLPCFLPTCPPTAPPHWPASGTLLAILRPSLSLRMVALLACTLP